MEKTPLSTGDVIEGRCTKCRKNTEHTIITLAENGPGDVQCKACERQHKYRAPTIPKKPAARRTVNRKEVERKEWEEMRASMNSAKAVDYSMTGAYKVNALINHPTFGLGMVQRIVGTQKVEVLFEDGKKTMRCR